jgi:hypothetical protein
MVVPSVDVFVWQRRERLIGIAVELHEDEIPNFDHRRITEIHERCRSCARYVRAMLCEQQSNVSLANKTTKSATHSIITGSVAAAFEVKVNFGARSAWAGVAHLPEVLLGAERQHVVLGQVLEPALARLLVARNVVLLVALEERRVQTVLRQAVDLGEQLPGPVDRFDLEVVAERPRAEHFEERVVVRVLADVVEIVVLAAGADALLRVHDALHADERRRRVELAREDLLELVHAGVGEEQRRVVVRHDGARLDVDVGVLVLEEVYERVAHTRRRPDGGRKFRWI